MTTNQIAYMNAQTNARNATTNEGSLQEQIRHNKKSETLSIVQMALGALI